MSPRNKKRMQFQIKTIFESNEFVKSDSPISKKRFPTNGGMSPSLRSNNQDIDDVMGSTLRNTQMQVNFLRASPVSAEAERVLTNIPRDNLTLNLIKTLDNSEKIKGKNNLFKTHDDLLKYAIYKKPGLLKRYN